jgi:predicted PP-loop superfamily ATPase
MVEENYICPFCGLERLKKKQIDFHLKYGHPELYEVMRREGEMVDMERKLEELREKKTLLEKEIKLIQSIIEKKK